MSNIWSLLLWIRISAACADIVLHELWRKFSIDDRVMQSETRTQRKVSNVDSHIRRDADRQHSVEK